MKAPPPPGDRGAYTLIEVLVVIAVIGLLLALVLGYFTHADYAAKIRTTEMRRDVIKSALEDYKKEFGEYPEPAAAPGDTIAVASRNYPVAGAAMLYQVLSHDGNDQIHIRTGEAQGVSNGSLDDNEKGQVKLIGMPRDMWTTKNDSYYLVDGFGRPFQYAKAAAAAAAPTTINPTFDLWSYGKDVENTTARSIDILTDQKLKQDALKWVRNW